MGLCNLTHLRYTASLTILLPGQLKFSEFYFLVSLLAARQEAQTKLFLFQRGKDAVHLLQGDPQLKAGREGMLDQPLKVPKSKLIRFLTAFSLHGALSSQLADLNLKAKRELSEQDVSILLYHVCKQFDIANAPLPAVKEAGCADGPAGDAPASPRNAEERNGLRTRVCCVS